MFTDLFIKFLMWGEKHYEFFEKLLTFLVACGIGVLIAKIVMCFPEFIKLIWR